MGGCVCVCVCVCVGGGGGGGGGLFLWFVHTGKKKLFHIQGKY